MSSYSCVNTCCTSMVESSSNREKTVVSCYIPQWLTSIFLLAHTFQLTKMRNASSVCKLITFVAAYLICKKCEGWKGEKGKRCLLNENVTQLTLKINLKANSLAYFHCSVLHHCQSHWEWQFQSIPDGQNQVLSNLFGHLINLINECKFWHHLSFDTKKYPIFFLFYYKAQLTNTDFCTSSWIHQLPLCVCASVPSPGRKPGLWAWRWVALGWKGQGDLRVLHPEWRTAWLSVKEFSEDSFFSLSLSITQCACGKPRHNKKYITYYIILKLEIHWNKLTHALIKQH